MTDTPDYVAMSEGDMLSAVGDDAAKWAAAFTQCATRLGHTIDESWMIGWFASAIEYSHAIRAPKIAEEVSSRILQQHIRSQFN